MSHYAKVNNGIVEQVIVAEASFFETFVDTSPGEWLPTDKAALGYTYDPQRDTFIPPKPFSSWVLNEDTCNWEAPTPYPGDEDNQYMWDEEVQDWVILDEQPTE